MSTAFDDLPRSGSSVYDGLLLLEIYADGNRRLREDAGSGHWLGQQYLLGQQRITSWFRLEGTAAVGHVTAVEERLYLLFRVSHCRIIAVSGSGAFHCHLHFSCLRRAPSEPTCPYRDLLPSAHPCMGIVAGNDPCDQGHLTPRSAKTRN